jgi:hypothetical protein
MVCGFAAERFNVGQYGFGSSPVLSSQANNLPEVLGVLQGQGMSAAAVAASTCRIFINKLIFPTPVGPKR